MRRMRSACCCGSKGLYIVRLVVGDEASFRALLERLDCSDSSGSTSASVSRGPEQPGRAGRATCPSEGSNSQARRYQAAAATAQSRRAQVPALLDASRTARSAAMLPEADRGTSASSSKRNDSSRPASRASHAARSPAIARPGCGGSPGRRRAGWSARTLGRAQSPNDTSSGCSLTMGSSVRSKTRRDRLDVLPQQFQQKLKRGHGGLARERSSLMASRCASSRRPWT